MTFAQFTIYCEKLEKTSSRLSLIDILSDLFKHAGHEEIDKIVYLTQGRIAPFYEATEIGMAYKNVAQAIAFSFKSTKDDVLKLYSKLGDMGLAAKHFAEKSVHHDKKITVSEVFNKLITIAKTSGEGSVEKKQRL